MFTFEVIFDCLYYSRCNKVLPVAEAAYQEGLPTHYVTNFHLNKVRFSNVFCY